MAELESVIEKRLIDQLCSDESQWTYRPDIRTEEQLWDNFKYILEQNNKAKLNDTPLSESEFAKIKNDLSHASFYDAGKWMIGENGKVYVHVQRGNETLHLVVMNNEHIAGGTSVYEVINQYQAFHSKEEEENRDRRFDVSLLINGIPLIHIELKNKEHSYMDGFRQIKKYIAEGKFHGIFSNVQMFVVSNVVDTKYFAAARDTELNKKFISGWLDKENLPVCDYIDFAKAVLKIPEAHEMVAKYTVLDNDKKKLLILRPYQIHAIEAMREASKKGKSGFIWHTTGSGKTLTSFKTSQLASKLDFIDKVLFVVDRKDLDYQTMKEYDRFKEGAANSNTSTKVLEEQLNDPNAKIIITTIQKLSQFIKKNENSNVFDKHVVFIFDECHRSQFGDMHKAIIKKFKKYYLFGFTGTPIFPENARTIKGISETTEQIFGEKLHTYTIVNAIADKNVLPFRYEYVGRVDIANNVKDEKIYNIDEEKLFDNQMRISLITNYIIDHFSIKTKTSESYVYSTLDNVIDVAKKQDVEEIKSKKSINGFNSIFAVSSIKMAKEYYSEFKKQLEFKKSNLKVALIYSYGVNGEDGVIDENSESTEALSIDDRTFLERAIKDYNNMFETSYDTSSEKFQNYYKDVSLRMKNREIDILIVANMFLTGFDAKTLNTLWVDKNLKWHGLIQAFSRTNRILNSVKTYGNIVSFRNLEDRLNEALAKFGDEQARGIVLLKSYNDYYYGYKEENGKSFEGYKLLVEKLISKFTPGELMQSEAEQKEFIKLYSAILRVTNILSSFDEFKKQELINERDKQDYHSVYIELYNEFRNKAKQEKTDVTGDVVFEMELIKSIEVNIDYILGLVKKYHDSNMEDKEILVNIQKAIMVSPDLRNKKDLIMAFIDSLDQNSNVYADFESFMNSKKKEELDKIIAEENLNKEETYNFIQRSFEQGRVETNGTEVSTILPPMNMFTPNNDRQEKKNKVIDRLLNFFDRFFSITGK